MSVIKLGKWQQVISNFNPLILRQVIGFRFKVNGTSLVPILDKEITFYKNSQLKPEIYCRKKTLFTFKIFVIVSENHELYIVPISQDNMRLIKLYMDGGMNSDNIISLSAL